MFSTQFSTFTLTLVGMVCLFAHAQVNTSCNPLAAACPANPGLATSSYFIDFTQQLTLPANWTLANFEQVTYGTNGAEFTFAKRLDAPYIWTDFYILFGRVEVVMQAATGVGIISSAVLISDDLDEIDWEFSGNNFNTGSGTVQTNYFGKGIIGNYDRGTYPAVDSPQSQFHTYVLDWSSTALTWSIDGVAVRTLSNNNVNSGSYQYPQSPMKLQIGLWDGGDASNAGGTVEWAGGYTDLSKVPFTMSVKSVQITNANPCSGGYQYTDTSGNYQSLKCVNTDALSSSNSTLVYRPNGSNQGDGASISSFLPASSSASPGVDSSPVALMSTVQSSDVVVPIQTSSSSAGSPAPPPMSSTVTSDTTMAVMNTTSGQFTAMLSVTSTVTTTICTNASVTSTSQAPACSSTQPASTNSACTATVYTAPPLALSFSMSSASVSDSASAATTPPISSVTSSSAILPTGPTSSSKTVSPASSSTITPAIFTGGARRVLPSLGWIAGF